MLSCVYATSVVGPLGSFRSSGYPGGIVELKLSGLLRVMIVKG